METERKERTGSERKNRGTSWPRAGLVLGCLGAPTQWKLLVAAAIFAHLGEAQRSSYAPRPGSNSKLLPRFRNNSTQSALDTRGGQEEDNNTTSPTLPPELQGTLEDHKFVQRVSQWPDERQPFWFKNRHAISSQRDRNIDGGKVGAQRQRPQFQSPFQGAGGGRGREGAPAAFVANDAAYGDSILYDDPFLAYFRAFYG